MKNFQILAITDAGITAITANDLDASHAYKVVKFKRAISKAVSAIADAERSLLKEVKVEDIDAFNKERKELKESGKNAKRLEEMDKTLSRFNELKTALYNEEADLSEVKAIPFEQFHLLQRENREIPGKPLNTFEEVLEGVLWSAPEE